MQNEDPEYSGGANKVSLGSARANYIRFGACEPTFVGKVRPPSIDEVPAPTVVQDADDTRRAAILRGVKTTLLGVVRAMLSGHIAVLEGCSAVAAIAALLKDAGIEDKLRLFIGVASEADEFPSRATRHLWSQDALAVQDQRAAAYLQRVEGKVRNACTRLADYLKSDLAG